MMLYGFIAKKLRPSVTSVTRVKGAANLKSTVRWRPNGRTWESKVSAVRKAEVRFRRGDWSNQELAHFHRAIAVLWNDGVSVGTDCGVSDDGDPWFAFCDADSDEVFAHFARISGTYTVWAPYLDRCLTGHTLRDLIERFLDDCPCRRPPALAITRSAG